jgi:hypothetical protein
MYAVYLYNNQFQKILLVYVYLMRLLEIREDWALYEPYSKKIIY